MSPEEAVNLFDYDRWATARPAGGHLSVEERTICEGPWFPGRLRSSSSHWRLKSSAHR